MVLPVHHSTAKIEKSFLTGMLWMVINLFATVLIVFVNKTILIHPDLRLMPSAFTAFHFTCTSCSLWAASKLHFFQPKSIAKIEILPLCLAFCGNIFFPNLSLAFTSVLVYQLCRVLVTPGVAIINWAFYGVKITLQQSFSILLMWAGVSMAVANVNSASSGSKTKEGAEHLFGLIFGVVGVAISCLYVIWIDVYAKRYQVTSMQLLFNQAPISTLVLLVFLPATDRIIPFPIIESNIWSLIFFSGLLAVCINISQFFIIHHTSALASTIQGNAKTCVIIIIGWLKNGDFNAQQFVGVALAIAGMLAYTFWKSKV